MPYAPPKKNSFKLCSDLPTDLSAVRISARHSGSDWDSKKSSKPDDRHAIRWTKVTLKQ